MTELWEFQKFDKIPRLNRGLVITEKIDGTNGQIVIAERNEVPPDIYFQPTLPFIDISADGTDYIMLAGSRKRWLTKQKQGDNYGFGRWVSDNRDELLGLGTGRHYGEWWGAGIQRKYGLKDKDKRFSLFNTARWQGDIEERTPPECCSVVPVILSTNDFSDDYISICLANLRDKGSRAAPGFMKPEGIVIYMTQARRLFKVTLENDGVAKSQQGKEPNGGLKTSNDWAKDYPALVIIDPDGWDRSNFKFSFHEELITRGEFRFRASRSTVEGGLPWK